MHCHYLEVDLDVVKVRLGFVPEQGVHGHDDAGGAEAALGPVRGRHSLLDNVKSSPVIICKHLLGIFLVHKS